MRAMCKPHLRGSNRANVLMLVLGMNESVDQLTITTSVHWYGHVREDGHVWRIALSFEVEGQRKKERLKRTWKNV